MVWLSLRAIQRRISMNHLGYGRLAQVNDQEAAVKRLEIRTKSKSREPNVFCV
jgi:hypothetical protein